MGLSNDMIDQFHRPHEKERMNRRAFLKTAGIGAAGLIAGCSSKGSGWTNAKSKPIGANEEIRIAVIGLHKQGHQHLRAYANNPRVRIVAICDVDDAVLRERAAELHKGNMFARSYRDMRELLDQKDIDAISIATPNHWHGLATVWGCQAGKHVLVEKPVSHCIWEGRKMVEAARKYRRMVQAGLNQRSRPGVRDAIEYLQSGELGKVLRAYAWDYKRRESIGKVSGFAQIPPNVDYNLWTGPAPMLPLTRKELHYDWHWQWATGNGEIGNNGVHWLDTARWALGKTTLPRSVMSFGGRYGYIDDGQTPNAHVAIFDYDGIPLIYESRGLPKANGAAAMDDFECESNSGTRIRVPVEGETPLSGIVIVCESGYLVSTTGTPAVYDNGGQQKKSFNPERGSPPRAFINALRSGKSADLKGEIEDGHISTSLCHMGNISILCGEPTSFENARKRPAGDKHASRAIERMIAHLAANKIDIAKANVVIGPTLAMDNSRERFTGDGSPRANLFVKNGYRPPFEIREHV
jgi:predicted dehydrogenase